MTVIAWDGKTLAADKLAGGDGLRRTTSKLSRINGNLVSTCGDAGKGRELRSWFADGADPKTMPAFQLSKDDYVPMLVITPGRKILTFDNSAYPVEFEDQCHAIGSGRDFALMAMRLGRDARSAVLLTSEFCAYCGNGVDTLEFE